MLARTKQSAQQTADPVILLSTAAPQDIFLHMG